MTLLAGKLPSARSGHFLMQPAFALVCACSTSLRDRDTSRPALMRAARTQSGIDFAADMVSEARRRYPNIEFHGGDAENLAFDTSSFDAVVCAFGLLHMQTRIRRLQRRIGCSVQMGGLHSRSGRGPTGMIFSRLW